MIMGKIFGLVLGLVIMFFFITTPVSPGGKVDCYDRWNNKIIGAECYSEPAEEYMPTFMYIGGVFLFLFSLTLGHFLDRSIEGGYL